MLSRHRWGTASSGDATLMALPISGSYSVMSARYVGGSATVDFGTERLMFDLDDHDAITRASVQSSGALVEATLTRVP